MSNWTTFPIKRKSSTLNTINMPMLIWTTGQTYAPTQISTWTAHTEIIHYRSVKTCLAVTKTIKYFISDYQKLVPFLASELLSIQDLLFSTFCNELALFTMLLELFLCGKFLVTVLGLIRALKLDSEFRDRSSFKRRGAFVGAIVLRIMFYSANTFEAKRFVTRSRTLMSQQSKFIANTALIRLKRRSICNVVLR